MDTPDVNSSHKSPRRVGITNPYFVRNTGILATSYVSSGCVHTLVFLSLWAVGFFNSPTTGEFIVETFAAAPAGAVLYASPEDPEDERISKFFRIEFRPALIKKHVVFEEPEPLEPDPEEMDPLEPDPEEPDVAEENPEEIDDYVRPDIKTTSDNDPRSDYIMFPDVELIDVFDESFSAWQLFGDFNTGGRPAVIVFCDVSREQGYNDLTNWADMWVSFLKTKGLGELPHVICIGSIIDDPYAHPIEYYEQALKMVFQDYRDRINDYTQEFAVTGVIDVHNQLLRALSDDLGENIVDLRKPLLMLVDNRGVIRVMMWGRPVDMSIEEIDKAGHIIREIWEMSDLEYILFRGIIMAMQIEQKKLDKQN